MLSLLIRTGLPDATAMLVGPAQMPAASAMPGVVRVATNSVRVRAAPDSFANRFGAATGLGGGARRNQLNDVVDAIGAL